jgi:hypothetical protein
VTSPESSCCIRPPRLPTDVANAKTQGHVTMLWASPRRVRLRRQCVFHALSRCHGRGQDRSVASVEAWPRHHVMSLLLGFVLHKAEDFVASFIAQHVCHSLCLLLLLPSSQRLAPAAMSHSSPTINSPHTRYIYLALPPHSIITVAPIATRCTSGLTTDSSEICLASGSPPRSPL